MNLTGLVLASGKAFILSLVLTPIIRDIFRSYNIVDRPGRRKVHSYPIPRVGGVPIAVAFAFALFSLRGHSAFPAHWLRTLLSGAAIIFLTGLIDDFLNLKAAVKFLAQMVAATVAFASGIRIESIEGIALPIWAALPLTVFWLLLTTNALNLIDGLDGLCAGIGFWGALAFFAGAVISGDAVLAHTALPLAGALLGFLIFNFNPATVFLGDSGALLIGFLLGCFGILWSDRQFTMIGFIFPLLVLCVPMADLALSIVRRTLKNQPIFSADRGHMHHRLLDRPLTVRRAAFTLYLVQITGSLFALLLAWLVLDSPSGSYRIVALGVLASAIAAGAVGIGQLRYSEFEVAGHLLFRGEFSRIFAGRHRMEELARALAAASTPDEWWFLLAAAAHKEKWIRVSWISAVPAREEVLSERTPLWSFSVPLHAGESILVEGDSDTPAGSTDLIRLSHILHSSFPPNRFTPGPGALAR